jgi:acetate kinase
MTDVILALNAGSSSIKFSLFVSTSGRDALSLQHHSEFVISLLSS